MNCQIEYVSRGSDQGIPYCKPAVAKCADCGALICSDCQLECCGVSFYELCYDYSRRAFLRKEACPKRAPATSNRLWFFARQGQLIFQHGRSAVRTVTQTPVKANISVWMGEQFKSGSRR